MKPNKTLRSVLAALLAVWLLLLLCIPVLAAENGTLSIRNVEDLRAFAASCASDSYSQNLKVTLTADIDAGNEEISIPVFYGTFDGQNHKISNIKLTNSTSDYGFFSRIESGAVVQNLTVQGEVTPSGTQSNVGGIAGVNSGTIEDCTFSGVVIGTSCVGGVVGKNASGGAVTGSTAIGVVRGTQFTGGVVGQNDGTVTRGTNMAAVNTTVSEEDLQTADIETTMYSLLKKEDVTENAVTTDTGGVVGYSTGILQSCTNSGTVGYPHVGYNVGGIAGRQNGYMANCTNRGEVLGRKDVGGIVGQMAPDITLQFSPSGLDELQDELNALQSLIDTALGDAESASNTVSGRINRISGYADSARSSANTMAGQLTDFTNQNIQTINDTAMLAERYVAKAAPIIDEVSAASGSVTETIVNLRNLLDTLSGMEAYNEALLTQLQSTCSSLSSAAGALESAADALDNAAALVPSLFPNGADTAQLRADAEALMNASAALSETVNQARNEVNESGTVSAETQAQLKSNLQTTLDCVTAVANDISAIMSSTDFGALLEQELETLRQIAGYFSNAMDSFSSAAGAVRDAVNSLGSALGTLRDINSESGAVLTDLDAVLGSAQQAFSSLTGAFSDAASWARELSTEEVPQLSGLSSEFSISADALNTSLSGISNELSALNSELNSSSTTLISDLRAVNGQFMKVMNLFLNVLNSTQNIDYTDVYEDVSEETLQSATRGKVLECLNYGAVSADRNVGGVAGAMAIEYDLDPEDDLLSSENRTSRFTYQTKAILLDCENYGAVTSRKSCAGGVVGRMDLGTVSGCGGYGDVTSENGDYVGGVCGLSLSSIRESCAKCTLSGRKYVGGIVASGSRVADCLSMVEIADCTQFGGAIAGEITGDYSGNKFVSDTLAGVDRISYDGKAEQVTYAALCAEKNAPKAFKSLSLSCVANGKTLKKQNFTYGDSFTQEIYPEAPIADGCYVRWDKTVLTDLHFDTVVTAVYEPYVTTLAADEGEDGRPTLLVEGKFREGDTLTAQSLDLADAPENAVSAWTLHVPDDGQESHTVRVLSPEKSTNYTVYVRAGEKWRKAESEVNGSYICVEMTSDTALALVPAGQAALWVWMIAAAALVLVILAAVLLVRRKKRGKQPGRHQKCS